MKAPPKDTTFQSLIEVMARLRDPDGGCPWDLEQTFETIAPYTLEEAYEVADAIHRADMAELKDELGDLLLQVVYHAQMAKEEGHFDINDVARAIVEKMIRRHPHVFGESNSNHSSSAQKTFWEDIKAEERKARGVSETTDESALSGIAQALPALQRAEKLQKRAARVGFDWPEVRDIYAKLDEELREFDDARDAGDQNHIEEEMGDILFVVANIARKTGIDPETALRKANYKFERRFRAMESLAEKNGNTFSSLDLEAQEELWQKTKSDEK